MVGSVPTVLRLRHSMRLGWELLAFALVNRVWWFVPLTMLVGLAVAVIAAGSTAAPYTIYTLF
jgi:hypothetical protein